MHINYLMLPYLTLNLLEIENQQQQNVVTHLFIIS